MRTFLGRVIAFLTKHWGFPGNAQWWWVFLGLPAAPTVVAWLIAYVREASWVTMVLVITGVYLVAFALTAIFLKWLPGRNIVRRESEREDESETAGHPAGGSSVHIEHAHFGAQRDTLVTKTERAGPVVLDPQEPGYHFGFNSQLKEGIQHYYDTLVVPYKFNDGSNTSTSEPTATIEVEDANDIFVIAFNYEVRSPAELVYRFDPRHEVWVEVRDIDNKPVKRVTASPEHGPSMEAATMEDTIRVAFSTNPPDIPMTWENTVSSSCYLHGLTSGVFGLRIMEEMARDFGAREYRNMRLTAHKL